MALRTLRLDANREADLDRAAAILRGGGLVAFPTETVYGLGANALDPRAVAGIFAAKGRPSWDPLIVHVASAASIDEVARIDAGIADRFAALAAAFWPGPLTMLLPRAPAITHAVTAGRERVGVRVPAHPVAQALLLHAGVPLAAPSANRFGYTSPTTADHVLHDLAGRIDAVLDGGPTTIGVESTVLDITEQPMRIYRPGAIALSAIEAVAGPVQLLFAPETVGPSPYSTEPERAGLASPGFGLRHYAPRAPLVLVADAHDLLGASLVAPPGTGAMLPDGWTVSGSTREFRWGPWEQPALLAQRLFAGLRELDAAGVAAILCPLPQPGDGLRAALRDRLAKAATAA